MSSTSPSVSSHHDNIKRKRVKIQNMSVAERLKMSRSNFRSHGYFENDGEEVLQYVEDGPIPEQELALTKYDQSTIRIIAQYLDGLGLKETVDKLVEESGCTVENSNAAKLRLAIQQGKYDSAYDLIDKCFPKYLSAEEIDEVKFQIEIFKLSDLMKRKLYIDAIFTSREIAERINPSKIARFQVLNAFIKELLSQKPKFDNSKIEEMRSSQIATIQAMLPTDFILPANRLKQVLENVNGSISDDNAELLLKDEKKIEKKYQKHECVQVLNDHSSEVWMVKFSPDGKFLATGSRSNHIILWQVKDDRVSRLRRLEAIPEGYISCMEWSPGNQYLAVCGTTQCKYNLTVFDIARKSIHRQIRTVGGVEEAIGSNISNYYTCCAFFASKHHQTLICGNEQGAMKVYNMNAPEESHHIKTIRGFRVRCVYGMKDGLRILASDSHNRIRQYRIDNDSEQTLIQEEASIVTFTLHPSEQLLLTTTSLNLRLWDLKSRTLIRYFSGACQEDSFSRYVIHACFGGFLHGFVATGTVGESPTNGFQSTGLRNAEFDGRVMIWNLDDCRPLLRLKGHQGHVNAVSWNPADPTMLASCADDGNVRIWRLDTHLTDKPATCIPRKITRQKANARKAMEEETWKEVHKNGSGSSISPSSSSQKPYPTFHTNYEYEKDIVTYVETPGNDCSIV